MSDNVAAEFPELGFVRPCNLCPHMKRISLEKILDSLLTMQHEVVVDPVVAAKARRAVERMVNLKTKYDPGNLFRLNANVAPKARN